jgi:hypothetical protein
MGESKNVVVLWSLLAALAAAGAASSQPVLSVAADSPELWSEARALPFGGELHLQGLALDGGDSRQTLVLERFRVFSEDARVTVHGDDGDSAVKVPDNAYFRGSVAGRPDSVAWLTARESGGLRGLIADRGAYWVMATGDGNLVLSVRAVDPTELVEKVAGFECASSDREPPPEKRFEPIPQPEWIGSAAEAPAAPAVPAAVVAGGAEKGLLFDYTARVAIETDFEFWQKFGSAGVAVDYIGDLIGYASTVYIDEIDTSLEVSSISLWSTSADPWGQTPGTCALFEFGRYWNDNVDEDRTIAHFLSGKSANVGVAWVGVLCRDAFTYNHGGNCSLSPNNDLYGGDYGFSGGIDGNFNLANPTLLWDLMVILHEIGHNFNSPHSHCYGNIGGNSQPVDECYAGQCGDTGCHCGPTSLPCAGGSGCGTLMSYCHFLDGSLSNIALTFGEGHPWGVAPQRVPDRMNAHVVSRAGANPGCLDPLAGPGTIFDDSFESGDTSAW